jgi:hypothetical protein
MYFGSREGNNMINAVNSTNRLQPAYTNEKGSPGRQDNIKKDETGAILELGRSEARSAVYGKPVYGRDTKEIDRLWREAEKSYESLREIVVRLVVRQGKKYEDVLSGKEALSVDESARAEARMLLSEDGELGVKAVSARIVNFAKALSGGDRSKLAELKAGIEKGFREAERVFGGKLPQICYDTYDEIMRQLDEWANEDN